MFCPACGAPSAENARYCQSCGALLTPPPAAPPPPDPAGFEPTAPSPKAAGEKPLESPPVARLRDRVRAIILDSLLMAAAILVMTMWVGARWGVATETGYELTRKLALIAGVVVGLVVFLYLWLLEGLFGATLGKGIVGIRVRTQTGGKCSLGASFIRNLLRPIDGITLYLIALFSKRRQRLGDHLAHTIVVQAKTGAFARAGLVILWLAGLGGGIVGAYVLRPGLPASPAPVGRISGPISQSPRWEEYVYNADGFAVSSPSEPKVEKGTEQTASGPIEMRTYTVELGDDLVLMWAVSDFSRFGIPDVKKFFQAGESGAVKRVDGKLASEHEISMDGNPGVEFEVEAKGFHLRYRYYLVKGKTIMVGTVAPVGKPFSPDAERFFGSLRLLPGSPASPAPIGEISGSGSTQVPTVVTPPSQPVVLPTGHLKVENFVWTDGRDGPPRAQGPYRPGDDAYANYNVTGFTTDPQGQINVTLNVTAFYPNGEALDNTWSSTLRTTLTSANTVITSHVEFHLPHSAPGGSYKLVIKPHDAVKNSDAEFSLNFEVK